MRTPSRPLLVLHEDALLRERLRRAAEGSFVVRFVPSWDDLPDALREAAHTGILVLDPYFGQPWDAGLAPDVRDTLLSFPSTTVVAALQFRPGWYNDVRALGEWGVAEVMDLGTESTHVALRQRLLGARGRPLRTLLERGLVLSLPSRGHAILDAAVDIVAEGGHARDLARSLSLSRDTLIRWCRRSGLPLPHRVLIWMRMLLAAELLDDPGQTVTAVAYACGYSSDDAFRRAAKSVLGMGPQALRGDGAFRTASAAFIGEVAEIQRDAELRERLDRRRRPRAKAR